MNALEPERPPTRRLFIAVPLPDEVRARVARLVEGVEKTEGGERRDDVTASDSRRRARPGVRWVRMDGLHVTLRFLGATPEERLAALQRTVEAVARRVNPFDVVLDGAGAFPSAARPRALWLGITVGTEQMRDLARELNQALASEGWPAEERPFKSHLTLGRTDGVRSGPAAARRLIQSAEGLAAAWQADRIVLFESHTGGGPARYEPLVEARFGGRVEAAAQSSG